MYKLLKHRGRYGILLPTINNAKELFIYNESGSIEMRYGKYVFLTPTNQRLYFKQWPFEETEDLIPKEFAHTTIKHIFGEDVGLY